MQKNSLAISNWRLDENIKVEQVKLTGEVVLYNHDRRVTVEEFLQLLF